MQIAWASETPGTTQIAWAPVRDSSIGNTLERSPPKAGFFLSGRHPSKGVRLNYCVSLTPLFLSRLGKKTAAG
jgi:hypothetical protein